MAGNEKRALAIQRLKDYYEDCQLYLQMLHRMYSDHIIPESIYMQEIAGVTAEMQAVSDTIDVLQRRQNT